MSATSALVITARDIAVLDQVNTGAAGRSTGIEVCITPFEHISFGSVDGILAD
jgi:hypothetical protein